MPMPFMEKHPATSTSKKEKCQKIYSSLLKGEYKLKMVGKRQWSIMIRPPVSKKLRSHELWVGTGRNSCEQGTSYGKWVEDFVSKGLLGWIGEIHVGQLFQSSVLVAVSFKLGECPKFKVTTVLNFAWKFLACQKTLVTDFLLQNRKKWNGRESS